jgi:hypothetical protein
VIEFKTPKGFTPPAKEALFSVDGKVVECDAEFATNFAINYLEVSLQASVDAANLWLLEAALGADGYATLRGWAAMQPEDLAAVLDALLTKVNKAMEPGKASASAG